MNIEREIQTKGEKLTTLRKKVTALTGVVESRHMGAFLPWDLSLEVPFQSTALLYVTHVNQSSIEKWGKQGERLWLQLLF